MVNFFDGTLSVPYIGLIIYVGPCIVKLLLQRPLKYLQHTHSTIPNYGLYIDALFALFWNMGTSYKTRLLKRTFSFLKTFYTVLLVGYVVAGVFSWTKSSDQYLH